jgi:hypothetical protein
MSQKNLEGQLKQISGPVPTTSDSIGLVWDLRLSSSNNFLGDPDAPGPGIKLPELLI